MAELNSYLPFVSVIVGAMAAYFGAFNAMRERMAKIEAQQTAHSDDINQLRKELMTERERINRLIERNAP